MTTTTNVGEIGNLLDLSSWAPDDIDDFDMAGVRRDYLAAINGKLEREYPGVTAYDNGMVMADVDVAERAREIDWEAFVRDIDVEEVFVRNERS